MAGALRKWEETVAGLALAAVFLSVSWGVVARYVAPQPSAWSNELATIGFAWVVFLGAAAGARRRLHIGIDLVTARLPAAVRHWLAVAVGLFLAAALAYVAWLALRIGIDSVDRPTPVLRLPTSVVHAAVVIGFASMAAGSLRDVVRLLGSRR